MNSSPQPMSSTSLWRVGLARILFALILCFLPRGAVLASSPSDKAQGIGVSPVHRYAIFLGTNQAVQGRDQLRYANTDANALSAVMSQIGGVLPANQIILEDGSRAALKAAFSTIKQRIKTLDGPASTTRPRIEFLFYYSGHSDEYGLLLGKERVSYKQLRTWLDQVPANVHLAILDSCASGAFTRSKGGKKREPFLLSTQGDVRGYAYLASSSEDESAQESDRIQGSFFTHYLISGLRGAADFDDDRKVTVNEAYLFARNQTLRRTQSTQGGAQHPAYDLRLVGTGDLILTDLRKTGAVIRFDESIQGKIFIRDEQERLVAELSKGAKSTEIALEPGSYQISRQDKATLEVARVTLGPTQSITLRAPQFEPVQREAISGVRGNSSLVASTNPTESRATEVPFHVSLARDIQYPSGAQLRPRVSIGLFGTRVFESRGLAVGLLGMSTVQSRTQGLQLALLASRSIGQVHAGQLSGVANVAQANLSGAQLAFGVNVTVGSLFGPQFSGLGNYAGEVRGLQMAMGFNGTKTLDGAQLSLGVNWTGAMRGLQFGAINIAKQARGIQVGVVNVAHDVDVSIAAIPIVTKYGVHAEVSTSDVALIEVGARFEAKHSYALWTAGMHPVGKGRAWTLGWGWGVKFPFGQRWETAVDLTGHLVFFANNKMNPDLESIGVMPSLRWMIAHQFRPRLSIFGGPTIRFLWVAEAPEFWPGSRPGWQLGAKHLLTGEVQAVLGGWTAGLRF